MGLLPTSSSFPDSFSGTRVSVFSSVGIRNHRLARRDPAGSFGPHVPLLIPSGTSLISHGNAMKLRVTVDGRFLSRFLRVTVDGCITTSRKAVVYTLPGDRP
jgi:hypothetical protein